MNRNIIQTAENGSNGHKALAKFIEHTAETVTQSQEDYAARLDGQIYCQRNSADLIVSFKGNGAKVVLRANDKAGTATTRNIANAKGMTADCLKGVLEKTIFDLWSLLGKELQANYNRFYHCVNHPRDVRTFNMLPRFDQALVSAEWIKNQKVR